MTDPSDGDQPQAGGGSSVTRGGLPPSVAGATATLPSRGEPGRITLAAVAGAHGIGGEVRLKLFADSPDNLAGYTEVLVGGVGRRLLSIKAAGKGAVARLDGVSDRSAAEALRGSLVEVDRDALPPLQEGEYYHADLLGLPCLGREGQPLGTVIAVENFGAGDLLEIEDGRGKRSLVPFRPGIADLEGARITVDAAFLA